MAHSTWHRDFFPIPGQHVFDREKQQMAAVARTPNNLDLFVIGFDNHVWTNFWTAGGGWNGEWFPIPGQHVFDREKQQMAAVARTPNNLDLFVIGFDNHVWTNFWTAGGGWNGEWFPIPGQHVFDREKQQMAAVARTPNNLDLFVIGFDNHVWTNFWTAGGGWNGEWFPIPGQHVFDREKQQMAAVARTPNNLDLFVIGFDNHVWTNFWTAGGGWNGEWFPIPGQHVFDREKQQMAAVARTPNNLDLFVIGFDNHVWTNFWTAGGGWNGEWFPIPGQHVFDREKQQMAAVARTPNNLDLFVIGFDNHVWTNFWTAGGGWNGEWFPIPGQHVFDREKQQMAAVARTPNNLDLFVIGFDNHVWTNFWGTVQHEFNAQIVTGGLAALGGSYKVTIYGDGAVQWQGEATNSGIDSYDFGLSALIKTSSGRAVALARTGSIPNRVPIFGDTIHRSWDELQPPNPVIAAHFDEFAGAEFSTNLEYESGIAGALEKMAGWLIRFGVGSAIGPLGGAVVFVGVEVGSLATTGSLVPGARIVGNLLWLAGPANTLFALAAEGIAALGSRTRELTQEEYDWANNEVFFGALPPRDRLVLTDTIGGGNRAFTFPRYDGKITLNMGAAAFDDPRRYPSGRFGQTFIHELVHACQIQHTPMDLALLADAFASKVCEATGGNPYTYGHAGPAYSDFNLEQQAQIVSDWFAGDVPSGSNQTGIAKDMNSPYFRYINENIRTGNL